MNSIVIDDLKKKGKVIRTSELVNPHFKKLWNTDCPYVIARGGRGSFKSSTISLKLVTMMKKYIMHDQTANVICLRNAANYLRDSVYQQISWALNMLDVYNEFKFYSSPLRITHKRTGSTFYFYGVDDPLKLKSNIVGNIIAMWYEEAANFKSAEDFDQTNPTFVRQRHPLAKDVKIFYSYNPPKNPYDWINEWIDEIEGDNNKRVENGQEPRYLIDSSTYLDDTLGINSEQTLADIERFKQNDYDYYRWLYLGEVVGLGTNVYNIALFHKLDSIPNNDQVRAIYFSQDSGQEVSATTESCFGLTTQGNVVLLNTYYYSPIKKVNKKAPSEFVEELHKFENDCINQWGMYPVKRSADSATSDFALDHQYFLKYGNHWHHVAKKKKTQMIDNVQNLLAQGRFFYLSKPENDIFIDEHKRYQWDADTLQSDDPKVIKEHDHTCDSFQYFVLDNLRDLGLKF